MYAKATTKFVNEIDPGGCLLPVSRLNDSDNLAVLSLVIKRKRFWFWQRPKYLTTDFTLNDVLAGEDINPDVIETDFLKYNSTSESNTSGGAEAGFGPGNVNLGGNGSSKLASSFGNLTKQEVDLQGLLRDCKDRVLDLQHSLLHQTRGKQSEVLGVVKERIVTTQPCTISEVVHKGASCGAFLGLTISKRINVSVKNGLHQSDSSVSVEIPAKMALAYSLIELKVKSTGHFDLCLLPDHSGGFETDAEKRKNEAVLYSTPHATPNWQLQEARLQTSLLANENLDSLRAQCKVLSDLPPGTRCSLFQQFSILLKDRAAISALDLALEDMRCGKKPDLSSLDEVPSRRSAVQTMLELFQEDEGTEDDQVDKPSSRKQLELSAITATHALSSALEEMSDSVLHVLEPCCRSPTIQALQLLVQHVEENRPCSLKDSRLAVLGDKDTYRKVVELFCSSNVVLTKEEDSISTEQGHVPLVLYIAICALASLAPPV